MNIVNIDPALCFGGNRLYTDYISGNKIAREFYTHPPDDFAGALERRRKHEYPRREIYDSILNYNKDLGAHEAALDNINQLAQDNCYIILTGQQAGFLGGPLYTTYKILTALRLAAHCTEMLGVRVVPLFWLASDDHDVHEINRTYIPGADGEIAKIEFPAEHDGRPVEAVTCDASIVEAYERYFVRLAETPFAFSAESIEAVRAAVPPPEGRYAEWIARIIINSFSSLGLVVVEPSILRPLAEGFYRKAIESHEDILQLLEMTRKTMDRAGYDPPELSNQAGTLFIINQSGRRVRLESPETVRDPDYKNISPDVVLRPPMVDSMLPVLAHVLGPGEIAYHAYLKPIYGFFAVDQPLLFPRKSYTVLRSVEAERLNSYNFTVEEALCASGRADISEDALPEDGRRIFDQSLERIEEALAPLKKYVEDVDPGLGKTFERTAAQVRRALDALGERTARAVLGRRGLSKGEFRRLMNLILPRGRMQERVFPLPFLIAMGGKKIIRVFLDAGPLDDHSHMIVTLEENDD